MKRGEVWTVSGGTAYAGKPRPAVVVQEDAFDSTASVTVCPFTSDSTVAPLFRLTIDPDQANGLRSISCLMVDKITTIAKTKLGRRIGVLNGADVARLNHAMIVFLGLAAPARKRKRGPLGGKI